MLFTLANVFFWVESGHGSRIVKYPTQTSTRSHEHRDSGQFQLALLSAVRDGVGQIFACIGSYATGTLVFAGPTGKLTRVFLEVRTLLPALVHLISTLKSPSTGPAALPALIGQVLVLTYAVLRGLRCGWIVGN